MTKHYSEADLLETYYTQPGQSMPVMMHLAACSDCAARYERLERKLRDLASCEIRKPETFWTRQRMLIMRGVEKNRQQNARAVRPWRVAAAAVLSFVLGGMVVYKSIEPQMKQQQKPAVTASAPQKVTAPVDASHDAWQSDELREFHSVVAWESWVDDSESSL